MPNGEEMVEVECWTEDKETQLHRALEQVQWLMEEQRWMLAALKMALDKIGGSIFVPDSEFVKTSSSHAELRMTTGTTVPGHTISVVTPKEK